MKRQGEVTDACSWPTTLLFSISSSSSSHALFSSWIAVQGQKAIWRTAVPMGIPEQALTHSPLKSRSSLSLRAYSSEQV